MKNSNIIDLELASVSQIEEVIFNKEIEKINQMEDDTWFFKVDITEKPYEFTWTDFTTNLPNVDVYFLKNFLIDRLGGYANPDTGIFAPISRHHMTEVRVLSKLLQKIKFLFPNKNRSLLTREELYVSLYAVVDDSRATSSNRKTTGIGSSMMIHATLKYIATNPKYFDVFSETLLFGLPSHKQIFENYCETRKINYSKWVKGKHHQKIPFYIAMPWLNFIVELFTSDDCKKIQSLWLISRKFPDIFTGSKYATYRNAFYGYYDHYMNTGEYLGQRRNEKWFQIFVKEIHVIFIETLGYIPQKWPYGEEGGRNILFKKSNDYIDHLYTLLSFLSGARQSEISGLSLSDFHPTTNDNAEFRSLVHKTNDGLPTIRAISGFAADAALSVSNIGMIDRKEKDVNLFYKKLTVLNKLKRDYPIDAVRNSYELFLDSLDPNLKAEFLDALPSPIPHGFRHTFAEFALRVSDGNVTESLRKHFRHALRSRMTKDYYEYKLTEDEIKSIERDYIKEIFGHIGHKKDHGYLGPMLRSIENLIDEKMRFIGTDDFEMIEDDLDNIIDEIDTIKVHEWGFCVPMHKTKTKSQCFNKSTKTPEYDKGSTFENCSGCIHLLSHEACKEDVQRIGLSISDCLEKMPIMSKKLRKRYEQELNRAKILLAQFA